MSNGLAVSEKNYRKIVQIISDQTIVTEKSAIEETSKYELGFILGIGTKFKKYSIDIRYENGNGMRKNGDLSSTTTRYYFLIGYKF